jgi:hypothetical protein
MTPPARRGASAMIALGGRKRRRGSGVKLPLRAGRRTKQPTQPWHRILRRPAAWIGGVLTAVLTAVLIATLNPLGPQALHGLAALFVGGKPAIRPSGPAVKVAALQLERSENVGDTYVFRDKKDFSAGDLALAHSWPSRQTWARTKGGVDPEETKFKLVLEGNRTKPVRIIGIQPIKHCQSPLTGTLLYAPPAGWDDSTKILFDLDKEHPIAQVVGKDAASGGDYFAEKTLSLPLDQQQTFEVVARTTRQYCEFTLEISIVDDDKTIIETIDNEGQPFQVTGFANCTATSCAASPDFTRYQALYVGGAANPNATPFGAFSRKNPATYH